MRQSFHKLFIILFIVLYFQAHQINSSSANSFNSPLYLDHDSTVKTARLNDSRELINRIFNPAMTSATLKPKQTPSTTRMTDIPEIKINFPSPNRTSSFYYKKEVDNYPELSKVEHLIKKFKHLFNNDRADASDLTIKTLNEPDAEKYLHLCGNHVEFIPAREVKNSKGKFVKVVNYDKYEQVIRAETCGDFLNTPCNNYLKNYHEGYTPMCKQNYISRKMAIFKEGADGSDSENIIEEDIPIPACCECVLKDMTME